MLPRHLLLARCLGERERYLRFAQHPLEMAEDGVLGLVERLAANGDLAVRGAEVKEAARLDDVDAVDGLLEKRPLDDHLERIERLDAERRLRHDPQRIDEEDVRRFDDVGRQRHLRQFLGGHLGRIALAVGLERGFMGGGSLRPAIDVAADAGDDQQHGHEETQRHGVGRAGPRWATRGDVVDGIAVSGHASLLACR